MPASATSTSFGSSVAIACSFEATSASDEMVAGLASSFTFGSMSAGGISDFAGLLALAFLDVVPSFFAGLFVRPCVVEASVGLVSGLLSSVGVISPSLDVTTSAGSVSSAAALDIGTSTFLVSSSMGCYNKQQQP